jgi:extracellular factor (EF) 3-hydroxypalmitic acid methyl ester biosynthesis protein
VAIEIPDKNRTAAKHSRPGASQYSPMDTHVAETVAHTGQHLWPDDLALDALRNAAAAFVALDSAAATDSLSAAVEHALRNVWSAIEQCEDAGIDKREILAHLGPARAIHARSPFIARAQEWPRGYPGDFETIEYLCAAENRAVPATVAYALEELALRSPITGQHRNKVAFQADAILAACRRTAGRARILSIGCGGCRDIRSIEPDLSTTAAEFVLCDLDYEALDFALHRLGPLASRCTYLNATIPRVLRKLVPYGPFDLAIAGGVFDYLPDRWVILSMRSIWQSLLAQKGSLVFTNIRRGNPFRVWLEYLVNWELTERDEQDIRARCSETGIPASCIRIQPDATGLALLVTCERPD